MRNILPLSTIMAICIFAGAASANVACDAQGNCITSSPAAPPAYTAPTPAPAPEARQAPHSDITLGMTCYPQGGKPYSVTYSNDAQTIYVTAQSGVTRDYPAFDVINKKDVHVLYVAAKRSDQERTMYFAFDYSHKGRDVSDIRVIDNQSDNTDKCWLVNN
jgi:hypothetical protein